jgi:hypothetical protein
MMAQTVQKPMGKPWLSATALLAFIPSFAAARLFTFLRPNTVILVFGIHFHHFWYGLAALAIAGWLGIAGPEGWNRIAAVMYGIGAGLVADEIGLLLTPINGTLGNYTSGLTYTAVVVITAVTAMFSLLSRYRREIMDDFRKVGVREPLAFLVLFILVVPFVVEFVEFQASLLGIILAVLYRWKLGGPWRLRRRGGFLNEVLGVGVVFLAVFGIAYLITISLGSPIESSPEFLLEFSRDLLILLSSAVLTGVLSGWVWVKFIVGPRLAEVSASGTGQSDLAPATV